MMGEESTQKNKGGRPSSYNEKYARLAYELAKLGATEKEIASILGIDQRTLTRWKKGFEEFCLAICNGKNDGNLTVKRSLYKKAIGYKFTETTKQKGIMENESGEMVPATIIRTVTKHVPPDVNACLSILRNRKKKEWE